MASASAAIGVAMPAQALPTDFVCGIEGDAFASPSVQLVGGSGTYSFNEFEAACVTMDANAITPVVVGQIAIVSNGSFNNDKCGTGFAADPGGGTDPNNNAYPADP